MRDEDLTDDLQVPHIVNATSIAEAREMAAGLFSFIVSNSEQFQVAAMS